MSPLKYNFFLFLLSELSTGARPVAHIYSEMKQILEPRFVFTSTKRLLQEFVELLNNPEMLNMFQTEKAGETQVKVEERRLPSQLRPIE